MSTVPIPSGSPEDFRANIRRTDEVATSPEDYYTDRFGVKRLTFEGMNRKYKEKLESIGWQEMGDFESGIIIENRSQIIFFDGSWYQFVGPLPHTTATNDPNTDGGIFSDANPNGFWVNLGADVTLRSDLSSDTLNQGDALIAVKQPFAGAVVRNQHEKNAEILSVKDFGATGNGSTDDTSAFLLAKNNGVAYTIPDGDYNVQQQFNSGDTPIISMGGNLLTTQNSLIKSFIDFGKKAIKRLTLRESSEYTETPTQYTYVKDLTSINIRHINAAGYQESVSSDAGGRTSVPAIYIESDHIGYGDCPGVSTHIGVQRHPQYASATNWTGMNSGVLYDGSVGAVTPNVNLYGAEWVLSDNANDRVSANGLVLNLFRNNGNGSSIGQYKTVWSGVRATSLGNYAADSALYVGGKWNVGLDFSASTLTDSAAIALKSNDRIYFGVPASSPPNTWYASTLSQNYINFDGSKYNFVVANTAPLQVSNTSIVATQTITATKTINIPSAGNTSSTATAGNSGSLPSQVYTYLTIYIDNVACKIPVYKA